MSVYRWQYLKEKRLEKAVSMSNKIRCLDVSLNLNTLAVGYSNGIIEFFDAETLAKKDRPPIVNFKNPDKEIISLIKFDREGKYLLVCYTPPTAFIMLYDMMSNTKKAEAVMKSKVLNADFSNDGKYIQLNT
jgi:WD40 repeat protein